ncbi:MAG: RNA polymerase sigma factor [Blautia sp.]
MLSEKLAVALYKLSSKERDVILLRYFQSMSAQEIVESLGITKNIVFVAAVGIYGIII